MPHFKKNNLAFKRTASIGTRIKVIGFGGAGCNTINRLSRLKIKGIELIAANTDMQSLQSSDAHEKILLGLKLTRGLGSGGNAQIGQKAAEESYRELIEIIKDADLVFLTAGMGGGTGSGAVQIAARIAKSLGVLTISIVSLPFSFEASRRSLLAHESTALLQQYTDTLITIPNDRLLDLSCAETLLETAFATSDDFLVKSIQGIAGLLDSNGLISVDFSHILRLMKDHGGTYISIGFGQGKNRAIQAVENALNHPLIENLCIKDASGIIVKWVGNIRISEVNESMQYIKSRVSDITEVIPAVSNQILVDNRLEALVLATGIGAIPIHTDKTKNLLNKNSFDKAQNSQFHDEDSLNYIPIEERIDQLEIPAFIRKGYNLIETSRQYD